MKMVNRFLVRSLFIILIFWCIGISAWAMSRPPEGASLSSYEFGMRAPLASQNDPWMTGYRIGFNAVPFLISFEQGFAGDSPAVRHLGLNFGLGSGPLTNVPGWEGLQFFGKLNGMSLRLRDGRLTSYSGLEFGLSWHVDRNWGWFLSAGVDYPGVWMAPAVLLADESADIRARDGLVTFLNFGIAFDPRGPFTLDKEK